jgi:hypothetical protein
MLCHVGQGFCGSLLVILLNNYQSTRLEAWISTDIAKHWSLYSERHPFVYSKYSLFVYFIFLQASFWSSLPKIEWLESIISILDSGMSQSYTNQRDKSTSRLTGYSSNSQRFDDRNSESQATLASQVQESVLMVIICVLLALELLLVNMLANQFVLLLSLPPLISIVAGSHYSAIRTYFFAEW